jgi:YD repeat-containing protein
MNYLRFVTRYFFPVLLSVVSLLSLSQSLRSQTRNDSRRSPAPLKILNSNRERDGLRGPVRRLRTEVARVNFKKNGPVEGARSLLELTVYDVNGKRIDNKTYPVVNSPLGQETYDYDDDGRLLRTTVRNEQGVILSRTEYSYEFDAAGNWIKMTSSVVVSESGQRRLEPVEVAYRTITYYTDTGDGATAIAEEEKAVSPDALTRKGKDSFPQIERVANSSKRAPSTSSPSGVSTSGPTKKEPPRMSHDVSTSEALDVEKLTDVGLVNDKALSLPGPAYSINWRKALTPVNVTVEVVIDETGRVIYAHAVEGPREFWRVAEDAARRAGFLPFRSERRPFKVKGLLRYSFPFDPR